MRLAYQFVALCLKPPGYKAGIRLARHKFGEERTNFVDKGSGALVISVLNSWGFRISWGGGISPTEAANYVGLYFLPSGLRGFGELRRRCETGNLLIALFFWFFVFLFSWRPVSWIFEVQCGMGRILMNFHDFSWRTWILADRMDVDADSPCRGHEFQSYSRLWWNDPSTISSEVDFCVFGMRMMIRDDGSWRIYWNSDDTIIEQFISSSSNFECPSRKLKRQWHYQSGPTYLLEIKA